MDGTISDESVCAKCGTPAEAGLIFCKKCGATLRPPVPLVASTPKSVHTDVPIYADAIGLVLIAVQLTVLFWWLVPDDGTRFIAGIVAYGVLVGLALAMWYGKEAKRFSDAYDWVGVVGGSTLLGALSFGVDMLVGSLTHPGMSPVQAGTKAGSPFGFILTIFLCPGVAIVAVAGLVRSVLVGEKNDNAS
jgi:hypothetical protein